MACYTGYRLRPARAVKDSAYMAYMNNPSLARTSPPVMEGKTYNVKIEDIAAEGDGIAKIDNFVIFVPGTKVGDKVDIKIEKVFRSNAFALVVKGDDKRR
jgi:23S rRNA (uracil1939-C5)-methyltransferase